MLLVKAFLLVAAIRLGLYVLPFRYVVRRLDRPARSGAGETGGPDDAARVSWAVRAASRRLAPGRPCLPQALAAQLLLRRRGVAAELRIGVVKNRSGVLKAHAWVVSDGQVVIGGRSSPFRYKVLSSSVMEAAL